VSVLPYWPTAQAVHVPPSVVDPAAQAAQAIVDTELYSPDAHAVHVVADAAASLSVIDPDGHTAHASVG
jgi:hypothetical protein